MVRQERNVRGVKGESRMDKVERLEQSVRELQVLCKKMVHTIALHVESTHDTKIQVTKKPAKVVDKYKAKPKDLDMVVDYFITKGLTKDNATKFYNHYEASGWMRGKTKIKNWKMCLSSCDFKDYKKTIHDNLWRRNPNGYIVGYCDKCGDSGMGNTIYDLKSSASCCGVQYVPTRPNKKAI